MWWAILAGCRPAPVVLDERPIDAESVAGELEVSFELDDETALLLALTGDAMLGVDQLEGPGGIVLDFEDWLGTEQLTSAVFLSTDQVQLNWPVREGDATLEPGRWTARVSVLDDQLEPLDGVAVGGVLRTKRDERLDRGETSALVLVPRDLDSTLQEGIDAALDRWVRVWRRFDIDVSVRVAQADLPTVVPDLFVGDPAVREAVALRQDEDLVVWIGEDLLGLQGALGNAGSIPNAAFDGPRAVIGINAGALAGPDARFTDEEARLFGEILAHEAGHWFGLFHPWEVELPRTDALDDTPTCSGREDCEAALGTNMMFPYPICGVLCTVADDLSDQQRAVLQRYVGTR